MKNNIRIIPSLLMQNKKLVKSIQFKNFRYIGDPINAIKIYNNLFVDELILLDINQSFEKKNIDFEYLKMLASECFIPLSYGGGVSSVEIAAKLYSIGFEKLVINKAASEDITLIKHLSARFGSQSIVGAMDCKKNLLRGHKVVIHNKIVTKYTPEDYAQLLEENGAGELFVNSIDKDGLMTGYDLELLQRLSHKVSIPIIASGGAGCLNDMKEIWNKVGINAFAAGSLFIYQSSLKAILINYPSKQEVKDLFD